MVWDIFNLEGETPVNGSFCLFLRTMFWNFDVNINSFVEINVSKIEKFQVCSFLRNQENKYCKSLQFKSL